MTDETAGPIRRYHPPAITVGDLFAAVEGGGENAWQADLIIDRQGKPEGCLANAITVLDSSPLMRGVLALDVFAQQIVVRAPPPWVARAPFPRQLVDADVVRAAEWIHKAHGIRIGADAVKQAAVAVAEDNQIDPVPTWLRTLRWDGQPRITGWMTRHMGAESSRLNDEIGRRWMISAVARACRPGYKVDHVLVLEGEQGIRKSSGLRALAGDEWFTDGLEDVSGREPAMQLAGKWIIEIAELNAIRGKQLTAVKRFVTIQADRYRAPWGVQARDWPRRCVFAATTNEHQYLQDTENRRYWPVRVGQVDTEGITANREQLWAEAHAAFLAGEHWWIQDEAAQIELTQAHDQRFEADPWEDRVGDVLDGQTHVTMDELLQRIGIAVDKRTRGDTIRIGHILKRAGWRRRRVRVGSRLLWRYESPDDLEMRAEASSHD